jgi:hypothetical protein
MSSWNPAPRGGMEALATPSTFGLGCPRKFWLTPFRTIGEITARIPIKSIQQALLYQRIAQRVLQLHALGMSYKQIGQALHVSPSLARKAHMFGCQRL